MVRRRTPALAAFLLSILLTSPGRAGSPPIQVYDLARGLAGDRVWDLELDAAGALWVATSTGVSRFDGARFRNFDTRHGLPHANVVRLLLLADGRLAAGTGSGVALLDPIGGSGDRPWRALPADVERAGGQLIELAEDDAGTLWVGGLKGLFRVDGERGAERLAKQPLPAGENGVRLLTADGAGGLWLGLERGLFHRSAAGGWGGPFELPAALDDLAGLTGMVADEDGALWLASRRALCAWRPASSGAAPRTGTLVALPSVALAEARPPRAPEEGFCVTLERGLPPTRSRRLIEPSRDGRLLVTGSDGLVEVDASGLRLLLSSRQARGANLQSTIEGGDGTLWVGTGDRGVLRLAPSGLEISSGPDGLPGALSTLLVDGEDVVVVLDLLDPGRRLLRLEGELWSDVTPPGAGRLAPAWGWGAISALAPDGAWWIGVSGGVRRFPRLAGGRFGNATVVPRALERVLAGQEPIRLFFGSGAALWVACHSPVALHRAELESGAVTSFPEVASFEAGAPSTLAEDADGTLWAGFFTGGLARRRAGERFVWMARAAETVRGFVYAMRFDASGELWVAAGGGLARCRSPRAEDPRCERALPGSELDHVQVFGVAEDRQGRILAGTSKGLFRVDPGSRRIDVVTTAEGLPGNNISAIDPAGEGGAWIATERGLARFAPRLAAELPMPVRFAAVSVAGRPRPVPIGGLARPEELVVSSAESLVELEVASIHLGAGAPPAYQWRIGGGDWSPPASDRRLSLAGLAPGSLTVEARAVSAAGIVGGDVARLELRVLPPVWRRAWFVALVAALVAAAMTIAYRVRVARLLALERVRTRIAADLHDDLGASLSRISILSEVARRQAGDVAASASTLETIGDSARALAEMASDIVWAIDPQRDDLASWASRLRRFGEDLFQPLATAYDVAAPPDAATIRLPAAARRDLYLLFKEAANNAAKYAGARKVRVAARLEAGRLEVVIEDDGRGFTPEEIEAAAARGGGHGLRTMRERATRLGGALEISSQPGVGTRIAVSFPL